MQNKLSLLPLLIIFPFHLISSATTCPKVLPDQSSFKFHHALNNTTRIIGGVPSSSSTTSYLVSLSFPNNTFACTGSLISQTWVLTAAHCKPRVNWIVRVAATRASVGTTIKITNIFIHEKYNPNRLDSPGDIALLKLQKSAPSYAIPILLLSNPNLPSPGSFVRTAGYGRTQSKQPSQNPSPMNVDAPVNHPQKCNRIFHPALNIVKKWFLCVGYHPKANCVANTCLGDSGGPLIIYDHKQNPVQVGIISFGARCGSDGVPGVYVRIQPYLQWIRSKKVRIRAIHNVVSVFAEGSKQAASTHTTISALLEKDQFQLQKHKQSIMVSKVIFVLICVLLAIAVIGLLFLSMLYFSSQNRRNSNLAGTNSLPQGRFDRFRKMFSSLFENDEPTEEPQRSDAEKIMLAIDLLQTVVENRDRHQSQDEQHQQDRQPQFLEENSNQSHINNNQPTNNTPDPAASISNIPIPPSSSPNDSSVFDTASEGNGIARGKLNNDHLDI